MINKKIAIPAVIAALMVLGSAAANMSRERVQQTPGSSAPGHDHNRPDKAQVQHDDHEDEHDEDEHSGHDHGEEDRDEHGEDEHDDHAGESNATTIQLTDEQRVKFGVKVATAGMGKLATTVSLPGEIVLNADRVAHIVPRAPGIVREVLASMGDNVRAGEVMAWIESAEFGEAKVDYLGKWTELGCCKVDLTRAQEVHTNTIRLLEVLNSSPSLESLRDMNGSAMGENRSTLVSAYAELVFAKAAYQRERPLYEKKVASERDYQAAEAEYKKADALYAATRDSVGFKVQRDLLEAKQLQRMRQIEARGARRRLFVLGLTDEEIVKLEALALFQDDANSEESACTDPNCTDCKAKASSPSATIATDTHQAEEKLAWYPLRAPFDGTVISKHLTLGEKHSDDSGAFTIADLSSVWVDIAIYQKDLPSIRTGMTATISAGVGLPRAEGVITYVAPVVSKETRTALARVVLPNDAGKWRPGLFVSAEIRVGDQTASVVVPRSAILRIDEESVVFLETAHGFQPTPVSFGRSTASHVEIISGLAAGQRYVVQGGFELKAKIVTSGLDPHAGHGH